MVDFSSRNSQPITVRLAWALLLLYGLSGITSLAYEVLWARMLAMQFGVSIFGVILTVAAFMLGLGLGSLSGMRWRDGVRSPLRLLAILEIAIALYALLLPSLMHGLSTSLSGDAAMQWTRLQWYGVQGATALGLLLIPAYAMGWGFALVLKVIADTPISLGRLYGINTAGGVAGALFPLWSLPVLGWDISVKMIALLGLLVGIAMLLLARISPRGEQLVHESVASHRPSYRPLLMYAAIGACSLMLEVGWVRLYGMVLLRTEYVLGAILAVFLLGIALGSLLYTDRYKAWLIKVLPFFILGGVWLSVWLLPMVSAWMERSTFHTLTGALGAQAIAVAMCTLPVTFALGIWLPLLSSQLGSSSNSGVWLYGANCLGGALGAVLAGVLVIPWMGSTGMVIFAGMVMAAIGLWWRGARRAWLIYVAVMPLLWMVYALPPVHVLLPQVEANSRDLSVYEDALSLTHVVQQRDGQRVLLSDLQRMDASTDAAAVEIQKDQARLALLLHPQPRSVLFLGLGTGISAAGSLPFPDLQRDAVELSRGAILAAQNQFAPANAQVMQQMQVTRDDARHYLNTTTRQFDVIIGDLFHPDLAGMGSLLSVQQFRRAQQHLAVQGVFVQWLALNQFDIESLKVVLRSFQAVFPDGQMFMDGMHLALVGSNQGRPAAEAILHNLQRMSVEQQAQVTGNEGAWTWLGRYWGKVAQPSGAVQDEWQPYVEYSLPRTRYAGNENLDHLMMWMAQHHPDGVTAMRDLGIAAADKINFGRAYSATELAFRSWLLAIRGNAADSGKFIWLAYQANSHDRWIANALADNMFQSLAQAGQHGLTRRDALERVLQVYPDHLAALRATWHMEQEAGNAEQAAIYREKLLMLIPLDSELSAPPASRGKN